MLRYLRLSISAFFRDFFPFTLRGFSFFVSSVFLLFVGLARVNLAILLWGSAFLLISLYTLIGSVLQRTILGWFFKTKRGMIEVSLPSRGLFIREIDLVTVKLRIPKFVLPGFGYSLSICFSFYGDRKLRLFHPVKPGESEVPISFKAEKRGVYGGGKLTLQCGDFLGLAVLKKRFSIDGNIRVYPDVMGKSEFLPRIRGGGERDEYTKQRKRSDELLEVRKYFPGDDLRKLNWNVFAHTGELFVRVGEETLQMKSNVLVVLDCTVGEKDFGEFVGEARTVVDDYLDEMVSFVGSVILSFLNRGVEISLWIVASSGTEGADNGREFIYLKPEDREKLLNVLAGVYWFEIEENMLPLRFPTISGMQGVIFSSPFPPVLDSLIDTMRQRKLRVSLFFKDIETLEEEKGFNIRNILFMGEGERKDRGKVVIVNALKRKILEGFNSYRASKKLSEVDLR